jgi:hypothetical protein
MAPTTQPLGIGQDSHNGMADRSPSWRANRALGAVTGCKG